MASTTRVEFERRDGLRIVGDSWGTDHPPAVIFLHGGGQTRHSWGGAAAAVAASDRHVLTLDARGHGDSDWSENGDYRLVSFADDLRCVIEQLDEPPVIVGASLGGLTTMLLAGELAPGSASGVVLVDIVPDMEPDGAQRVREFMVQRAYEGFGSLDEVADMIAAYNPHRERPSDLAGLGKNLRERDGRYYWHWDPRFMDPEAGMLPVEVAEVDRLTDAVARIVAEVPMMLVRGRVSDLVSETKADEFIARFPDVEFVDVSGAGHMVAGDRNDAFTNAIVDFLGRRFRTRSELHTD